MLRALSTIFTYFDVVVGTAFWVYLGRTGRRTGGHCMLGVTGKDGET